jgi:Glucose / Sorbosone dehydrogenase
LLGVGTARAATLQSIGSFTKPIYLTSDPANGNRLFVVEREGEIEEIQPSGAIATFADIRTAVRCCDGERGLLSIALAPDFETSGRLYVDYVGKEEPGEIHVAELRANGSQAPASSLRNVLTIPHPLENNHNGGQLQFGPEGLLFISTGDGGGGNDQHENAQNLSRPLGKILRIDPLASGVLPFTVPGDNPFVALAGAFQPIWSYGLRNPFRFSFDSSEGGMTIGDVGQGAREEVDYAPAPELGRGANYGWNCREGQIAGPGGDPQCGAPPSPFVDPVFDFPHNDPEDGGAFGCAILGGYVVRDPSLGDLYGRYLYGDLCSGRVRSLDLASPFPSDRYEGLEVANLNSFGEDACGRLYAISGNGAVFRFVGSAPAACPPASASGRTYLGIRAQRRRVQRNRRALITVFVSPCRGRKGEPVRLLRNGHHIATRRFDVACTVRFRPRISQGVVFRATFAEDSQSVAVTSRRLKIRIDHRRHRR